MHNGKTHVALAQKVFVHTVAHAIGMGIQPEEMVMVRKSVVVDKDYVPEQWLWNTNAINAYACTIFAMLTGIPKEEVRVDFDSHRCWWEKSDGEHFERIEGRLIYETVLPYYGLLQDDTAFFVIEGIYNFKLPDCIGTHRNFIIHGVSTKPEVVRTY